MSEKYLIRSGSLMGFEQAVNALGGDAEQLLMRVGLSLDDLQDSDHMIAVESFIRVLDYSAQALNCSDFGLRLAQYQDWSVLGDMGSLVKNGRSLESLSSVIQRYFSLHSQGEYWDYRKEEDYTYITRHEKFHNISHACQHQELSFGVLIRLLQDLVNHRSVGVRLEFSHKPISELSVYKNYFPMDVRFSQECNRMIFDNHQLTIQHEDINPVVQSKVESDLSQLLNENPLDIESQVRTVLIQTMASQEHSIDQVASLLKMNRRTLQRKLKAKALDYTALLNDVRMSAACWYLKSSDLDITVLSEMLGYSDVSAFSHAFKNRMGCFARQWRNESKLS